MVANMAEYYVGRRHTPASQFMGQTPVAIVADIDE
jgi:hypothetical protein